MSGFLVHCVDDDEARCGRFAGGDGLWKRVGEEERPQTLGLFPRVDRQSSQQDHPDGIGGQLAH